MDGLARWICLTAAVLATAQAQLQLFGTSVVDENFFVVGELQPGETFDQFKRRFRQQNPSANQGGSLTRESDPGLPRVPAAGSSTEPLGLPSGATEVLGRIDESFSCEGLPYGYYSDLSNDCRVYHVCNPSQDGTGTDQYSFFCNAGLEFDQQLLTCVYESPDRSACSGASQFYESSNSQFFRDVKFNAGSAVPALSVPNPTSNEGVTVIGVTGGVPVEAIPSLNAAGQTGGDQVDVNALLNQLLPVDSDDDRGNTDGAGLLDLRIGFPRS